VRKLQAQSSELKRSPKTQCSRRSPKSGGFAKAYLGAWPLGFLLSFELGAFPRNSVDSLLNNLLNRHAALPGLFSNLMKKRWTLWVGVALALAAGCGDPSGAKPAGGHHHESVHGGTAVELGTHEFNLDVVLDEATGRLAAYVMSGHMDGFIRIPAESFEIVGRLPAGDATLVLKAVADHTTGEKVGDTSLFEVQSDALKGLPGFDAVLKRLSIRGKSYENIAFRVGRPAAGTTTKP